MEIERHAVARAAYNQYAYNAVRHAVPRLLDNAIANRIHIMFSTPHTAAFCVAQTQVTATAAGLDCGRAVRAGMETLTCPPAAHS